MAAHDLSGDELYGAHSHPHYAARALDDAQDYVLPVLAPLHVTLTAQPTPRFPAEGGQKRD
jgi:hypothetical protein